jgi:hypothetical protein
MSLHAVAELLRAVPIAGELARAFRYARDRSPWYRHESSFWRHDSDSI